MNKTILQESIKKYTHFTFSRSSGKGGQNVNKVNTKVYAFISLADIEGITDAEKSQIKSRLSTNINKNNELFISVQQERSQELNRKIALQLIELKIVNAGKIMQIRKKTKVPIAVNERRLQQKKLTSKIKQMRSKNW